jgi:hypothetical protein
LHRRRAEAVRFGFACLPRLASVTVALHCVPRWWCLGWFGWFGWFGGFGGFGRRGRRGLFGVLGWLGQLG